MQISEFTFRLILIFIPGIVSFIIIDNLTVHKKTEIHHWLIYSLLLGFMSYIPWAFLLGFINFMYKVEVPIYFLTCLTDITTPISLIEILIATFVAIVLGIIITKMIETRLLFSIASQLGVSKKFPEIDAWDNFVKVYHPKYITVRNLKEKIIYQGILVSSSDANDRDGIVLEDVTVYDEDGDELYRMKVIYIPQKMENLVVEIDDR